MTPLRSMGYSGVSINSGKCREQVNDIVRFLLNLDEDRMLNLFRKGAGLSAPKSTYTGWYGQGATTFGQWIGAMAKLYRATGDRRLREKMASCLDEWAKCIRDDGYTNFSLENASTYGFEKIAGGLVDAFEYADYEPAMDLLERITHWADRRFSPVADAEYSAYAHLAQKYMHEWYTLGENYYRAFLLSGRTLFRDFAEKWDYHRFWKDMAEGNDRLPPLHAYSHVNSLCGAAQKYLVTKDMYYLNVLTGAYRLLTERHLFATGGFGPAEALFGTPGYLGDSLLSPRDRALSVNRFVDLEGSSVCDDLWGSCEVSCCAWAVFKLTQYLLAFTGRAGYAEWAESLIINGTLAQLSLTDDGKVEYYANYFRYGARKDVEDRRIGLMGNANLWQCCTGTFPQAVAAYHDLIYFQGEDGVFVSQYIPSTGRFRLPEGEVTIEILGDYPEAEEMEIRVRPETKRMEFPLFVRIPAWADGASAEVNGEAAGGQQVPGQWFELRRAWCAGDAVTLRFPFRLRFVPADAEHKELAALTYGPLVLAADEIMTLKGDMERPDRWIVPRVGERLVFETLKGHDQAFPDRTHVFRPFYSIGPDRWYYMYTQVLPQ